MTDRITVKQSSDETETPATLEGRVLDLRYTISDVDCFVCKGRGYGSIKMEVLGDHYVCPLCKSGMIANDPFTKIDYAILEAYDAATKNNDALDYTSLNHPHSSYAYLSLILEEARKTIMMGFYLPGILTLNNYIEALAKEIIFLNEGVRFRGDNATLGAAIKHLKTKKYITPEDANKLTLIKNNIRNPYTHGDATYLLQGLYQPMRMCETTKPDIEYMDGVANGSIGELRYLKLADMPNTAFVAVYDSVIRNRAIDTYNEVVDLAREFTMKYLDKTPKRSEINDAFDNGLTEEEIIKAKENNEDVEINNCGGKVIITTEETMNKIRNYL